MPTIGYYGPEFATDEDYERASEFDDDEDYLCTYEEEYQRAVDATADSWVPACGGKERPFEVNGRTYLYVWNPARQEHGYLVLDNDLVVKELPR